MKRNNDKEKHTASVIDIYKDYVIKFFRTIPKDSVLITKNVFNGKRVSVRKGGFAILFPWQKSKLVSIKTKTYDYKPQTFEDKNGQDLIVDISVSVRIKNPLKYEYTNENIELELKSLLDSIMRVIINKFDYEFLKRQRLTLPVAGSCKQSNHQYIMNGHVVTESIEKWLAYARIELDAFTEKYGLEVVELYTTSVQQSEKMQAAYDEKIKAEKNAEAELLRARAAKERAKINAETTRIDATARAEAQRIEIEKRLIAIKEAIKDYPPEKQQEIIKAYIVSQGGANVFFGVDSNANSSVVSGAVAGNVSNRSKQNPSGAIDVINHEDGTYSMKK